MVDENEKTFNPPGMGGSTFDFDRQERESAWADLTPDSSCAFDFISTARLFEWLDEQNILDIPNDQSASFHVQRQFARFADSAEIIPKLVLFDKIYLNTGGFYQESVDLSPIKKEGFFTEYPRPYGDRYLSAYSLLKPLVVDGIATRLASLTSVPFNDLWTDRGADARDALQNFTGLASWLYDEWSKASCGLDAQESAMAVRIRDPYESLIWRFMEFALAAQGSLMAGCTPMVSSIVKTPINKPISTQDAKLLRDDVFALYRQATSAVIGVAPTIHTWDDVLRLRDDRRLAHVRTLISKYHSALATSEKTVVEEMTKEISDAKRALDKFAFKEHPVYTYVMKSASYVPVVGTLVSIVNDCIDLAKAWETRKYGWIYFGMK